MTYGNGDYRYELVENWAKLPASRSFLDIGGMGIDTEDRVYIANQSQRSNKRIELLGSVSWRITGALEKFHSQTVYKMAFCWRIDRS